MRRPLFYSSCWVRNPLFQNKKSGRNAHFPGGFESPLRSSPGLRGPWPVNVTSIDPKSCARDAHGASKARGNYGNERAIASKVRFLVLSPRGLQCSGQIGDPFEAVTAGIIGDSPRDSLRGRGVEVVRRADLNRTRTT